MSADDSSDAGIRVPAGLAGLFAAALLLLQGACSEPTPGSVSAPVAPMVPAAQLRLGTLLGGGDLTGFALADRPREFVFPADHGPHPGFRSEWWYLTLVLEDETGAELGAQFTLFRQALVPEIATGGNRWQTPQVYLAHFALTDVSAGYHHAEERFARGHPRLAGVRASPFELWLEDWRIDADGDSWRLRAGTARQAVDISLRMDRTPVLQGEQGLSRKGPRQASYYYSIPGISATGRVRIGDRSREVHGLGWLDREWSTSVLGDGQRGWDWFALNLSDGRHVMMFQLRREDGVRDPYDQGLILLPDGSSSALGRDDFTLKPCRYWVDGQGTGWPVAWDISLGREHLRAEALLESQKMDTSVSYWEGLVAVHDATGARAGRGYLELTGYDGAPGATACGSPDADHRLENN